MPASELVPPDEDLQRPAKAARSRPQVFNLPNQLSALRLVLAIVMFTLLARGHHWSGHYWTSLALFLTAAGTDWLDGFLARRYGMITTLGRILDPFADKVIICGTFVYLVAIPQLTEMPGGLRPWMVVVILGRELLVTALRSFLEERGRDFSAQFSGKLKMVLQCVAAAACLVYMALDADGHPAPSAVSATLVVSLWSAVALTIYSGVVYVLAAVRLYRSSEAAP